ncbi:unnamed protein product [Kluyveromyces dobzhanskii CBS 2104]|uniref:mRNA-capping enzyme subunit beta n=1 Tax=Kluyveromyces dobzhanskii CBS 2104 TaxID=1427455 RepID=A0A0A8L2M0_9SACH|nr:unnamed protein product [Kluyveromyces dobzhanskii CBS 2104]
MKPSRGLSLTDLVNHDDTPPLKSDDTFVKPEEQHGVLVGEANQRPEGLGSGLGANLANVLAPGPVITNAVPALEPTGASEAPAVQKPDVVESDETDTDDEPGEIVFENTKFKFDDEEVSSKLKSAKGSAGAENDKKEKEKKAVVKESSKNSTPAPVENSTQAATNHKGLSTGDGVKVEEPLKVESGAEIHEEENGIKPEVEVANDGKLGAKKKDIFQQKSSNASVKNNIKKDLKILSELSSSSLPKRYNVPPVWARKWKHTVRALQAIDSNNLKLDESILAFIPEDDLTKSVQDWIYATLIAVDPELRQFVEVEMKYGVIIDPSTSNRVNPPVSSQCVFTDLDSTMKPDVDERVFDEFNRYIKNLSELNENMGKFNIIDSFASDLSYRVRTHTERPKFLRMTRDVNTGRIAQFIEKRKISQILLYSPKDSYDTKISISLELPVPDSDPPEKYQHHTPTGNRIKKRTSYIHNDSCTRFDITKVENKPIRVNNKHEKEAESDTTYEVELEINTPALLNAFENIQHDSKEYAAIVRTFLNNGTIVRRKLSSLSYDIYKGSNKL